jgi:hypothetical protein
MIIQSADALTELLRNKRIALLVFNKDTRNLLRFYQAGMRVTDFSIPYLIDLTLDYREHVHALAQEVTAGVSVVIRPSAVQRLLDSDALDLLLCFDRNLGTLLDPANEVHSLEDCDALLRRDYEDYARGGGATEFNFRWSMYAVDYISLYAAQRGIYSLNAHWQDMYPRSHPIAEAQGIGDDYYVTVRRSAFRQLLQSLEPGFESAKVRIVIGSDWGAGKTSYLYNRMKEGSAGIAGDLWFALTSRTCLPNLFSQDVPYVKGAIANQFHRAWKEDPRREIFLKLDGRLEEYVCGIPFDHRHILENLRLYFEDFRFDIVLKPGQEMADIERVYRDFAQHYGITDNVRVHRMGYDGSEQRLV